MHEGDEEQVLGGVSGEALTAVLAVLLLQINKLQSQRLSSLQLQSHEIHTHTMVIQ